MTSIQQVAPPTSLKSTLKFNQKKCTIISHLEQLLNIVGKNRLVEDNPLIIKTRMTLEMTEFTCNLIENVLSKNNKNNIDKKALALEILSDIYNLSSDEQDTVDKQIQYIYDSELIVRIPIVQKLASLGVSTLKNFLGAITGRSGL